MRVVAISGRSDRDRTVAGLDDSHLSDPFRDLLREWERCARGAMLPERILFEPWRVGEALPNLAILEIMTEADDFHYRLTGTRTDAYFGRNFTGRRLSELPDRKLGDDILDLARRCRDGGRPIAALCTYTGARDLDQECRILMLPWTLRGTTVEQLIAVHDFRPAP